MLLRYAAVLLTGCLAAPAVGQNETRPSPAKIPSSGIESTGAHTNWNSRLARNAEGVIAVSFFDRSAGTVQSGSRTGFGQSFDGGSSFSIEPFAVPVPEFTGVQDLVYSLRDDIFLLLGGSTGSVPRQVQLSTSGGSRVDVAASLPTTSILGDGVLAVVNDPASPFYGRVYVTGFDFATQQGALLRSDDINAGFAVTSYTTPAGVARLAGLGTDRNGDLLLVALGTANDLYFYRSTDGGVTLSAPVALAAKVPTSADGLLDMIQDGILADCRPRIVSNPATGNLYVVYAGRANAAGDRADVWMQVSYTGGISWSSPFRLSEMEQGRPQWAPDIAFNGSGRAIVTWNDADWGRRSNTFRRSAFFVIDTADGVRSFSSPFPLTPSDSPIVWDSELDITGPGHATTRISDREGQVAVAGGFVCTFAQTHLRAPGVERQYQADVYSVFVPESGFGPQVQALALDIGGVPSRLGEGGCYQLRPLLINYGSETPMEVTYTAEILSGPPGIALTHNAGRVTLPGVQRATYAPPLVLEAPILIDCQTAGQPVVRLTMRTSDGAVFSDDLKVPLWSSDDVVVNTFSVDGPIAVPDSVAGVAHGVVEVPIEVSGLTPLDAIGLVSLALRLPHTYMGDLRVELIDNTGVAWLLANRNGSRNPGFGAACPADSSTATVFASDPELTPLEHGRPPFLGYWQPAGDLSDLAGRPAESYNGTWRLRVSDHAALDVGTIECATLQFHGRGCGPANQPGTECTPVVEFVDTTDIENTQPFGSDFFVGPGECHARTLRLANRSHNTLTNLRGRIVAAPDSRITTGNEIVRFPDIMPGASAVSLTGFMLQTSGDVGTCPSVNEFTFIGECDQGPVEVIGRVLVTGVTYGGGGIVNNTPANIPANGNAIEIPFTVNLLVLPVATVELEMFIEHTAVGELELALIDPLGTQVQVLAPSSDKRDNLGTSSSAKARFRDSSTLDITDPRENSPLISTYKPAQSFAAFAGTTAAFANGTWKLRIRDTGGPGTGTFRSATLFVLDGGCDSDPSPPCENSLEMISAIVELGEDAILEPGDCTRLRVGLRNNGVLAQTNARLILDSSQAVAKPRDLVTFPTIAPGAIAWADEPFVLQTDSLLACEDDLELSLGYASDQSSQALARTLPFGYGSVAIGTVGGSSGPVAIPDFPGAVVASPVVVGPFSGRIANMEVSVHVTHGFVGDLELTLISPTGIRSRLISRYGGSRDGLGTGCSTGDFLLFKMDATQMLPPLTPGTAPVTGEGTGLDGLLRYVGLSGAEVNGTWLLEARDFEAGDTGTIQCWAIGLGSAACDGSGPPCSVQANGDQWLMY
jgi:subtilisin-like proprotein convertase family protein